MAKRKKKQAALKKKAKRRLSKAPLWVIIVLLIVGGLGTGGYFLFQKLTERNSSSSSFSSSSSTSSILSSPTGESEAISIHFLELGNANTGDSIYIKAGENDILIDAGSRVGSASSIESYLEDSSRGGDYVSDKKLEYVIATHAHQDHIAGMVGKKSSSEEGGKDGILYHYKVDHLIDFSYYDDGSSSFENTLTSSSNGTAIYKSYLEARNYAISKGTVWKTAGQIWNSGNEADRLVSLGKGLSMRLLYNFFYDHTSKEIETLDPSYTKSGFSSQNDDSVCLLFSQGEKHFLFTGDAEEYAESSLVKYNSLPEVDLFKAGHHGSYTASGKALLDIVRPRTVCVCCCAGNQEYASLAKHSFPAQEFIDRIAPFTDEVYVTSLGSWDDASLFLSFNGNIVIKYAYDGSKTLSCSNNHTKLKDSDWFKSNRTVPDAWSTQS